MQDLDRQIAQAIGLELRRVREQRGWTRPEFVKKIKTSTPVNTYACYEQGIRQCSIPHLIMICDALEVSVRTLLHLAFQRMGLDLEVNGVLVNLDKIVHAKHIGLRPLSRWADKRIHDAPLTVAIDEPTVVHLPWDVVKEFATMYGASHRVLLRYIEEFTPNFTPHRATQTTAHWPRL